MKIGEYFEGLLQHKRALGAAEKTIKEYSIHIKYSLQCIADIELEDFKIIDVDKVIADGRSHGRYGSLRGVVIVRQLLKYIKATGAVLPVDWRDITLPPVPKKEVDWLDPDEWEKVRNAFDLNTLSGLRDRALMENLRVTGMRISEALNLNRDSIDWEKKEAEITNAKAPYELGKVYFTDESLKWLKLYLDMRNDKFPPLFATSDGARATPSGVRRTIHHSMKAAGITKRIHPHILRSTFCTELLFGGVDIKTVQTLARHRSERTTLKHYTAVSKSRCKEEHNKVMSNPMNAPAYKLTIKRNGFKQLSRNRQIKVVNLPTVNN